MKNYFYTRRRRVTATVGISVLVGLLSAVTLILVPSEMRLVLVGGVTASMLSLLYFQVRYWAMRAAKMNQDLGEALLSQAVQPRPREGDISSIEHSLSRVRKEIEEVRLELLEAVVVVQKRQRQVSATATSVQRSCELGLESLASVRSDLKDLGVRVKKYNTAVMSSVDGLEPQLSRVNRIVSRNRVQLDSVVDSQHQLASLNTAIIASSDLLSASTLADEIVATIESDKDLD